MRQRVVTGLSARGLTQCQFCTDAPVGPGPSAASPDYMNCTGPPYHPGRFWIRAAMLTWYPDDPQVTAR